MNLIQSGDNSINLIPPDIKSPCGLLANKHNSPSIKSADGRFCGLKWPFSDNIFWTMNGILKLDQLESRSTMGEFELNVGAGEYICFWLQAFIFHHLFCAYLFCSHVIFNQCCHVCWNSPHHRIQKKTHRKTEKLKKKTDIKRWSKKGDTIISSI